MTRAFFGQARLDPQQGVNARPLLGQGLARWLLKITVKK